MKYAILALGLLVTPAAAETYSHDECYFVKQMLENCTIKPDCEPIIEGGGGMSRASTQLAEAHPNWDWDKFDVVCKRVCDGKITTLKALYKYCPGRRPDLIRLNSPPYPPGRHKS